MNKNIDIDIVKKRLTEFDLEFEEVQLQNGYSAICLKRGGRLFGPFDNKTGESILWMNDAFKTTTAFAAFLSAKEWNIGGDRLWIAPEMPFFVKNRNDFFETYIVQEELDPGNYIIDKTDNIVTMKQDVSLNTFEVDCPKKELRISKTIRISSDPLLEFACYPELVKEIDYCGFEQKIELTAIDNDKTLYLEAWLLTQINPAGKLIVPYTSNLEYVDYYEPLRSEMFSITSNHMEINVTGDERYKIGFKASQVTGKAGYIGYLSDGRSYLFIRTFANNPSNIYCSDPYDRPKQYGCSMFLYNDQGGQGGFAEFENSGATISGDTGMKKSVDVINYYLYVGKEEKLNQIVHALLGVNRTDCRKNENEVNCHE